MQNEGGEGPNSSQPMVLVPIVSRLPGGHTVVGDFLGQNPSMITGVVFRCCLDCFFFKEQIQVECTQNICSCRSNLAK